MKTKIFSHVKEWNYAVEQKTVTEDDLKNGHPGYIPILCESCRAKIVDREDVVINSNGTLIPMGVRRIWCGNCHYVDYRKLAPEKL